MSDIGDIWELRHGDELVGKLTVTGQLTLIFYANFEPTDAFQQYKHLFDEQSNPGTDDAAIERTNQLQEKLNGLLDLVSPHDTKPATFFMLHIIGNTAGFRAIFNPIV